jgi:GNAT superfamily N-acetyltransferase
MKTPVNPDMLSLATADDYPDVVELLDIANQYAVKRSGVPGWTAMEYVYGKIKEQIENGEIYVLRDTSGSIVASVAFNEDGEFWGDKANDGEALYFQKLLKNPDKTEANIGKLLLGFVAQAAQKRGKKYLRCDTVSELTGLLNYYERLGFVQKGEFMYDSSDRPGVLLEAEVKMLLNV